MLICLSGLPGIGKTTLIKKLMEYFVQKGTNVEGFLTEEIRDNLGNREGFDIITLRNERAIFARKRGVHSSFKVGNYCVDVVNFERLVLPLLSRPCDLMIIDEIGKMELFSEKFKNGITNLMENPNITIVATVPLRSNDSFIDDLKRKSRKIINVHKNNRDNLLEEIITMIHID